MCASVGEPLARSQTTAHKHGHPEATMELAGPSLGRELRARALSHTAPAAGVAPPEISVTKSRTDCDLTQQMVGAINKWLAPYLKHLNLVFWCSVPGLKP